MSPKIPSIILLLTAGFAVAGCEIIAGITDRHLAALDGGATGGATGSATGGATGGAAGNQGGGGRGPGGGPGSDGGLPLDSGNGARDASNGGDTAMLPATLAVNTGSKDYVLVVIGSGADAAFEITNTGGAPSGVPMAVLGGTDMAQFSILTNGCNAVLGPQDRCTVTVRFSPTSTGQKSAALTVIATPGGSQMVTLTGRGATPGSITLKPTSAASPPNLGAWAIGDTSPAMSFTVTNGGGTTTGPVTVAIANSTEFKIATNGCGVALTAGGACTLTVNFTPTGAATRGGTLTATALPGGEASLELTGKGLYPAHLLADALTHNFGPLEVGVASFPFSWKVTNSGDVPSGALTLMNTLPAQIATGGDCTGALAAGASCTITISFKALSPGNRGGTLALSDGVTGAQVTLTAQGLFRLTVTKNGTGTVTSASGEINCGSVCSALVPPAVTLQARTANGSGMRFAGWSGGGCSGVEADCPAALTGPTTVTATFSSEPHNLVFITSMTFPANLGSAAAYDAKCDQVAGMAGINVAAGSGYVAIISDAAASVQARLGSARGWVRMDGRPFADTLAGLFTNNQIFDRILYDENGHPLSVVSTMTGTTSDGMVYVSNCSNWTVTTGFALGGSSDEGVYGWLSGSGIDCSMANNLICMGKTKVAAVSPTPNSDRKVWFVSGAVVPGAQTPDALCKGAMPTGVTNAAALLSYADRPASLILVSTARYSRPDGTLVGTGAQIAAGTPESGIWQKAGGAYWNPSIDVLYVLSGSALPSAAGTAGTTCGNWTSTASSATMGSVLNVRTWWEYPSVLGDCKSAALLYCVQTAP